MNNEINYQIQEGFNGEIYGWTLEMRNPNGIFTWSSYWNNRIYQTKQSAISALSQVSIIYKNYEWRVLPLYRMSVENLREYKIGIINNVKIEPEIIVWKVNSDFKNLKKGDIIIKYKNGTIQKAANTSNPTSYIRNIEFKELLNNNLITEIDIKDERWIFPHLCKQLKNKMKNEK